MELWMGKRWNIIWLDQGRGNVVKLRVSRESSTIHALSKPLHYLICCVDTVCCCGTCGPLAWFVEYECCTDCQGKQIDIISMKLSGPHMIYCIH